MYLSQIAVEWRVVQILSQVDTIAGFTRDLYNKQRPDFKRQFGPKAEQSFLLLAEMSHSLNICFILSL